MRHLRRDILPYTLLCDLSRDIGVCEILVCHGDVFPPDMVLVSALIMVHDCRLTWLGPFMCSSKMSIATLIRAGCATQVPSWPAWTSLNLSALTLAMAASFFAGSFLIGICADIPPIAATLRLALGPSILNCVVDDSGNWGRQVDQAHLWHVWMRSLT